MTDREKVIKETEDGIAFAESRGFGGLANTMRDALALLKEKDTVEHACDILRANGWTETEPICSECDAIHVVRCKDCAFYGGTDIYRVHCQQGHRSTGEMWFCGDGKPDSD